MIAHSYCVFDVPGCNSVIYPESHLLVITFGMMDQLFGGMYLV